MERVHPTESESGRLSVYRYERRFSFSVERSGGDANSLDDTSSMAETQTGGRIIHPGGQADCTFGNQYGHGKYPFRYNHLVANRAH